MNITPVTNNTFEGKLILKNKISTQQNYLFNLHRPNVEKMIQGMPFDLFVEQSKSKKTISLTTNVQGANSYFVRKNKQNFEEIANLAIQDGMKKSEEYKKLVKSKEILWYIQLEMQNVAVGKFKEAREAHKQIAKLGIEDFDLYRAMINFKIINLPPELNKILLKNSIKYKIYNAFSSKTQEEKELYKMSKQYVKEMKEQKKEIKPVILDFSKFNYYPY